MAKLTVMCARSMHVAAGALGRAFADASGHEVAFDFGTVGGLQAKLDAGETADVVVLSVPAIGKLDVSFQEVVHSVRAGKAEVVEASVILGGPNEHPQECPVDATASRGDGALRH
jgi:hypothetical protein